MSRKATLLLLLLLLLFGAAIPHSAAAKTATKTGEAACEALAEAIGQQSMPQCRIMLPPSQFGYSTNVSVVLLLKTIYGLDEKELLEFSAWIQMTWTDPRLTWNSSSPASPQHLRVDRSSLWLPDIGFLNSKGEMFDLRNTKFADAVIFPAGEVGIYTFAVVQFACAIDVRYFPFDSQLCTVDFSTVSSDTSVFNLSASVNYDSSTSGGLNLYQVGEWELKQVTSEHTQQAIAGDTYFVVHIKFHMKRRWMYYTVLVIVPFELLSLLASVMFLAGDKSDPLSLSIAIIMSMTLYILIASESAPKSMSTIPLVGLFLMAQMLILIAFTFISAFKVNTSPTASEVQSKLKRFVRFLARHKNVVCFVSYISLTAVNMVAFMYA